MSGGGTEAGSPVQGPSYEGPSVPGPAEEGLPAPGPTSAKWPGAGCPGPGLDRDPCPGSDRIEAGPGATEARGSGKARRSETGRNETAFPDRGSARAGRPVPDPTVRPDRDPVGAVGPGPGPAVTVRPDRDPVGAVGPGRDPAVTLHPDPDPTVTADPDPDPAVDEDTLGRIFLGRVIEPGDEVGGRWVREFGVGEVVRRVRAGGEALPGVSKVRWAGLVARGARAEPERDLAQARAAGARFVPPGNPEWPRQLDDLADARPLGLWVRGRPSLRMWALRSVAVVGARACTEYGTHVAATLAVGLAERGWVVVSGGAYGIDAAAHRGALAAGGATVAVLAGGVDRPYPRGHTTLIERIAQQGLVIGELPPGDHPTPSRFILRNRVIAALTRGTVVVEAACRSGSLATARAAQRLGRHTMGVPEPLAGGAALAPIRFRLAIAA